MPKYLGYAADLALGQDAEGNVSQWYHPGDDIQTIDAAVETWLVNNGYTFDPMPEATKALTFEDEGSGPAMVSAAVLQYPSPEGSQSTSALEQPAQQPAAPAEGGQTPAQQPSA